MRTVGSIFTKEESRSHAIEGGRSTSTLASISSFTALRSGEKAFQLGVFKGWSHSQDIILGKFGFDACGGMWTIQSVWTKMCIQQDVHLNCSIQDRTVYVLPGTLLVSINKQQIQTRIRDDNWVDQGQTQYFINMIGRNIKQAKGPFGFLLHFYKLWFKLY